MRRPRAAAMRLGQQLAFHQYAEVRAPMVKEVGDPARYVERDEAVENIVGEAAFRQALVQQFRRGDGARGEEQGGGAAVGKGPEERQEGDGFADAGRMQPDQLAGWAGGGVDAVALGQAVGDFLTAPGTAVEHRAKGGRGEVGAKGPSLFDHAAQSMSARSAASFRAATMCASAGCHSSRPTGIAAPQTTTPRPNGSGMIMRSQLRIVMWRVV